MYTIGEVAKRMDVAPSTLRFYDKEGLLPFVERTAGGVRRFKDKDFEWLNLIECMKAAGMPIRDIKQFIDWYYEGDSTLEQRRRLFHARKRSLEQELASIQKILDTLTYKCWYYDTAVELGSAEAVNGLPLADLPPDIQALKKRMDEAHAELTRETGEAV